MSPTTQWQKPRRKEKKRTIHKNLQTTFTRVSANSSQQQTRFNSFVSNRAEDRPISLRVARKESEHDRQNSLRNKRKEFRQTLVRQALLEPSLHNGSDTERFSNDSRKTNTKVNNPTNHNRTNFDFQETGQTLAHGKQQKLCGEIFKL